MSKTKIKTIISKASSALLAVAMTVAYFPMAASASPITKRSVVMGSSVANASTSYDFTFTATSGTIKSIKFQACDTASTGACTHTGAAADFSSALATINGTPTGLGGAGSWTIDDTDTSALRIKNNSNTGTPSADAIVKFNSVHNPSAANATFYIRITTYSDDAWTTPASGLDNGVIAVSTAAAVVVTATVDETLSFTLTNSAAMTNPTPSSYGTATSTFTVGTNAATGYSVAYKPANTLTTADSKTIDAMPAKATLSAAGSAKEFGINLAANGVQVAGSAIPSGGHGAAFSDYATANQFIFKTSGDNIAQSTVASNNTVYTVSYIANVTSETAAGAYSTNIDYVATANF